MKRSWGWGTAASELNQGCFVLCLPWFSEPRRIFFRFFSFKWMIFKLQCHLSPQARNNVENLYISRTQALLYTKLCFWTKHLQFVDKSDYYFWFWRFLTFRKDKHLENAQNMYREALEPCSARARKFACAVPHLWRCSLRPSPSSSSLHDAFGGRHQFAAVSCTKHAHCLLVTFLHWRKRQDMSDKMSGYIRVSSEASHWIWLFMSDLCWRRHCEDMPWDHTN